MMWSSSCCCVLMSVILESCVTERPPRSHEAPGRPDHGANSIRSTSRVLLHLHRRRRCRTQYAHARRQSARTGTAGPAPPRGGAALAYRWIDESFHSETISHVIREAAAVKLTKRDGAGQAEDSR